MIVLLTCLLALLASVACSQRASNASYKESIKKALEQADLKDVTVSEDAHKNTITLGGIQHSEDAKQQAGQIAQAAAGSRIIANGIKNNYKAALVSKGLDKEHIRVDARNGVVTLKGTVKTPDQRKEAEQIAANIPNVAQVVNELEVRR